MSRLVISPTMMFQDAAADWLKWHTADIKERTIEGYRFYIRNLGRVFHGKLLSQITSIDVLDYQQNRKHAVSAGLINHEVNTLKQIMVAADLWHPIERHYKQLKAPQWTRPKVLTPEEEERFFKVANSKPEWQVAAWACIIGNNTTAIGSELRYLQLKHVFLDEAPPKIRINDERVKNEFRARIIPLNPPALAAMRNIVDRARKLGAYSGDHYILPARTKRNHFDVTRPASRSFIQNAFRRIRKAAGLEWLHYRNFRNQAITKLFESGAADETITSIAGHQSIKMSRFYSRIRIEAKADALGALAHSKPLAPSKPKHHDDGNFSVMREAAQLVKETGIDVGSAIRIARDVMAGVH